MGRKKNFLSARGRMSVLNENVRYWQERLKSLENNIEYYERLAQDGEVLEDGTSPYQPILAELYREVSDLEFALACPAAAS